MPNIFYINRALNSTIVIQFLRRQYIRYPIFFVNFVLLLDHIASVYIVTGDITLVVLCKCKIYWSRCWVDGGIPLLQQTPTNILNLWIPPTSNVPPACEACFPDGSADRVTLVPLIKGICTWTKGSLYLVGFGYSTIWFACVNTAGQSPSTMTFFYCWLRRFFLFSYSNRLIICIVSLIFWTRVCTYEIGFMVYISIAVTSITVKIFNNFLFF